MGLHWMYDSGKSGPKAAPPAPRSWVCEWIDPDSGKTDRNTHATEADAEQEAASLRGIDVRVIGVRRISNARVN